MEQSVTDTTINQILQQKPFDKFTAINYCDEMSNRYNKIYCVVTLRTIQEDVFDIISIKYFKKHLIRYIVHHISIPRKLKC